MEFNFKEDFDVTVHTSTEPTTNTDVVDYNNPPYIICKFLQHGPHSNIDECFVLSDSFKQHYHKLFEKVDALASLYDINESIYNILTNYLHKNIRDQLIYYQGKHLIKVDDKYFNVYDFISPGMITTEKTLDLSNFDISNDYTVYYLEENVKPNVKFPFNNAGFIYSEKYKIKPISYITEPPTSSIKAQHKDLIVPNIISEKVIKQYYEIDNTSVKNIFKYRDVFCNIQHSTIDNISKDNYFSMFKKLEHISKLININDILVIVKSFIMELSINKLKIARYYNDDESRDILMYYDNNGRMVNQRYGTTLRLVGPYNTIIVNDIPFPVEYIGWNLDILPFEVKHYESMFEYKIMNYIIPYNGDVFKIIFVNNKCIKYSVDGNIMEFTIEESFNIHKPVATNVLFYDKVKYITDHIDNYPNLPRNDDDPDQYDYEIHED